MKNQNLGTTAKDKLTGFKGTVTGFCQYLTGCDQYYLLPAGEKEGMYPQGQWLDANRLDFEDQPKVELETSEVQGADFSPPAY